MRAAGLHIVVNCGARSTRPESQRSGKDA